jgi:N4-gp56 family major capsid protein
MAEQVMITQAARIGKMKGEVLRHVMPVEVFGKFGLKKPMPKNMSDTVVFRRWLPKGATTALPNNWVVTPASHQLTEGETPTSETVTAQDITVSLVEYGFIYRWSNRVEDLYEDDVPSEIKRLTGERMGLLLEMIRFGQLKAGTNVFRAGGVASRALIIALVSANQLRNIQRGMSVNLASKITNILSASAGVGTQPIEAAFVGVCSSDLEADIRSQLSGFVHVSEYGNRQPIHENELGSWESFRFITSPHLTPYLAAGGTTAGANTRLTNGVANSAGTEAADIYPMVVLSQECFGDVALRGTRAMQINSIPAATPTKDDILGQRGMIGASTYFTCVRLNEGQMAVYEMACSFLV